MTWWWKILLPLALVLPAGAYALGVATRQDETPSPRETIVIEPATVASTDSPARHRDDRARQGRKQGRGQDGTGGQDRPTGAREQDDDDDDVEVVYPDIDVDDDDDDRDDRDDDGAEDDDDGDDDD